MLLNFLVAKTQHLTPEFKEAEFNLAHCLEDPAHGWLDPRQKQQERRAWVEGSCSRHSGQEAERKGGAGEGDATSKHPSPPL